MPTTRRKTWSPGAVLLPTCSCQRWSPASMTSEIAGRFKTEFRVGVVVFAQFGGADARGGREFLQRVEQGLDGGGLRGIGNGFGQQPHAVRAVGANFQRAGRNHLNAGDGGRAQFRQDDGQLGGWRAQEMFKNKNEREQRRGDQNQIPVVFEFIIFSAPARPASRTAAPRRAARPATASGLPVVESASSSAGIP